jgi:hypothetical protein
MDAVVAGLVAVLLPGGLGRMWLIAGRQIAHGFPAAIGSRQVFILGDFVTAFIAPVRFLSHVILLYTLVEN